MLLHNFVPDPLGYFHDTPPSMKKNLPGRENSPSPHIPTNTHLPLPGSDLFDISATDDSPSSNPRNLEKGSSTQAREPALATGTPLGEAKGGIKSYLARGTKEQFCWKTGKNGPKNDVFQLHTSLF